MKIIDFKFRDGKTAGMYTVEINGQPQYIGADEKGFTLSDQLQAAVDLGLELDLSALEKDYEKKIQNRETILLNQRKKEAEEKYHHERGLWEKRIAKHGKGDNSKCLHIESFEEYMQWHEKQSFKYGSHDIKVGIKYRGHYTGLEYKRKGHASYDKYFCFTAYNVTDSNREYAYKKVGSAINKFIQLVNNHKKEIAEKEAEKKENERFVKETLKDLAFLFGKASHEKLYNRGNISNQFYLHTNGGRKVKIWKGKDIYSLGNIENLSEKQVIKILEII
jgi:hypothetical protein